MAVEERSIVKNFLSLAGGYLLVRLVSFVATLIITRTLGPASFGALSFGLTLAVILSVLANLGLDDYVVREIARDPRRAASLLGSAATLKLLALPVGALGVLVLALSDPRHALLYLCLAVYGLLNSYLLLICAVLRGHGRMELQTLLLGIQVLLIAVSSVATARLTGNVVFIAAGYVLATLGALAAGSALLRRRGLRPRLRWDPAAWLALGRRVAPFGVTLIGFLLFDRLAIVSIALCSGQVAVGWFNAVYSLILILSSIPTIVLSTIFPLMSRLAQHDRPALSPLVERLVTYTTIISLSLALTLPILAPALVHRLFGAAYGPSVAMLQVLALALPAMFLTIALSGVMEAMDQQRACAAVIGRSLVVAVPLTMAACKLWGYQGGVLAYVACHTALACVMVRLAGQAVSWPALRRALVRPAVAALGLALIAYAGQAWSPLVVLPPAFLGYGAVLLLTGAVGRAELLWLRGAMTRGRTHDEAPIPARSGAPVGYAPD